MLCEPPYTLLTFASALPNSILERRADVITFSAFRYACKSSTNHSPFSTVSTPFAASASKNGLRCKPLEHHLRTQIQLPAHHVEHQYGIPGPMQRSLRCWTCIYKPIQAEPGTRRRKRKSKASIHPERMCCRGLEGEGIVVIRLRIGGW